MAIRLGHDGDDFAETHEINVTPFIDVILVLLIIFMIAAPLATVDVPVDLPATTAQKQERPDKPVFLTIKADRTLAIGDDPVPRDSLAATLERASKGNRDERIFLYTVPQKSRDPKKLLRALVALIMIHHDVKTVICGFVLIRGSHSIPCNSTARDVIERIEETCNIKRVVISGRHC